MSLNSEPCVRKQQHSPSSSSAQLAADNGAVVYRAVRQYEMRNGQFDIGLFEVLYRDPCVMLCSIYCKIGWGRLKLFAIRETMSSVGTQLNCSDVVILMTRSQYAQAKSIFPFFFFFFFNFFAINSSHFILRANYESVFVSKVNAYFLFFSFHSSFIELWARALWFFCFKVRCFWFLISVLNQFPLWRNFLFHQCRMGMARMSVIIIWLAIFSFY